MTHSGKMATRFNEEGRTVGEDPTNENSVEPPRDSDSTGANGPEELKARRPRMRRLRAMVAKLRFTDGTFGTARDKGN